MQTNGAIDNLLEKIQESSSGENQIKIEHILEATAGRSYGPLLFIPGLVLLSPIGAIPALPGVIAIFLILVTSQLIMGKRNPWVPKKLREKSVDKEKAFQKIRKVTPYTKKLRLLIRPRLVFLTEPPIPRIIGLICLMLSISIFPLGFIPFAVMAPAFIIMCFGLSIMTKDGLLVTFSLALSIITPIAAFYLA